MERQDAQIKEIRELAGRFSPEEIEVCIRQQLTEGANVCEVSGSTEQVVNELAKAGFVRDLVDQGVHLTDAVRELAKRIRTVQRGFQDEEGAGKRSC